MIGGLELIATGLRRPNLGESASYEAVIRGGGVAHTEAPEGHVRRGKFGRELRAARRTREDRSR